MRQLLIVIYLAFVWESYAQLSTDSNLQFEGRIGRSECKVPVFYWAGSSATIHFTGTSIGVTLDDSKGNNFFQVIIDGHDTFPILIDCKQGKHYYHIAAGLPKGEHMAKLIKRTEAWEGSTQFLGFKVDGEVLPRKTTSAHQLKMEFYGNSITSGMGNEDLSADGSQNQASKYKNHYLSYASISSRKLNAEHRSISLSGIGILVSWDKYIMPEIYNRVNPFDENSLWDFSLWTPDIVVVNLFQNDSWIVNRPDNEQFKRRFDSTKPDARQIVEAYISFIRSLRKEYPNANIICALGSMDATREGSQWPAYVVRAVDYLKQEGDANIYRFVFPYNEHGAHPTVFHNYAMADLLVNFIVENGLNKTE